MILWKLKHALQMWTWCLDFEIRVKWWSTATHRFTISVKCTQSWNRQQQQQRKQPKNNIDPPSQKLYRLYAIWFKQHNRILIYQSHTKPFYVQYHQPERFCPRALHVICPNAKYTWQSPGKMLQSEIQEGFCPDSSSSSGNKMKSFQDDLWVEKLVT